MPVVYTSFFINIYKFILSKRCSVSFCCNLKANFFCTVRTFLVSFNYQKINAISKYNHHHAIPYRRLLWINKQSQN